MTRAGTRKPRSRTSTWLPGLPRWASDSSHEASPTAWCPARCRRGRWPTRSSSAGPRPAAASGERSCASSRTTWPRLGVRSTRSASSSSRTASASDQRAAPLLRGRLVPAAASRCSSASRTPSACAGEEFGVGEQPEQHLRAGRARGQTASAYCLHRGSRATASCTRSSGESPLRSIASSTWWASRCGSIAAAGAVPDARARAARRAARSTSYAGTRQRCAPRGTTSGSVARRTCAATARGEDRGQPRIALEDRDAPAVGAADRGAVGDQLLDRRVADADLAERGQHGADVLEEARGSGRRRGPRSGRAGRGTRRAARPPGAGRRRSCRCRGRPGRRSSCRPRHGRWRPARAGSSRRCRASGRRGAARSPARGLAGGLSVLVRVLQVLVLVGRQPAAVEAEAAAAGDAHRLGPRGPVEGAGEVRAPVDDERVARLVVDVPAADVPGLVALRRGGCRRGRAGRRRASRSGRPGATRRGGRARRRGTRRRRRRPRRGRWPGSWPASAPARGGRRRGGPARGRARGRCW